MRRPLAFLLRATGLLWLWRLLHRRELLILTVHGVMDDTARHAWQPLRQRISPRRLDQALRVLRGHFAFVPLDEAVDMLAGVAPMRAHTAVLTFDDGYRNHVTHALPILRRQDVPATVFVASGLVESPRPFWFDRLDYALQHAQVGGMQVPVGGAVVELDASSRDRLDRSFRAIRDEAKAAVRDDREMCRELEALAARLEVASGRALAPLQEDDPWSAILTVDDLRSPSDPLRFGSHTVDHLRLHQLDPVVVADQLRRSKRSLEEWTGRPCEHFCYPDGGVSVQARDAVASCGYRAAVTTRRGRNRQGDDLMMLRRIDLPAAGTTSELLVEASGLLDALLNLRERLRDIGRVGRRTRGADGTPGLPDGGESAHRFGGEASSNAPASQARPAGLR
ncbi:MAG: polysaccharide deacetylase family protein [Acidobacteria bacterium]|nr:polysaccharide deacetylase family protein [Acidobacteriota bacterium]